MSKGVLKDKELDEYYQALFEMHGSAGWRKLTEDFGHMLKTYDSIVGLDTEQQLWFRKGQLDIIGVILGHAEVCERAYATLLAEQDGGEEAALTGGVAKVVE